MATNEHIIWQDEHLDLDDWREDLLEDDPDLDEDELTSRMHEINSEYLDDERANLGSLVVPNGILCVATLGLWNGTPTGYQHIKSGKISDCLYASARSIDTAAWYVDERGEFRSRQHHHDGTNTLRYRGIKPGVSEEQMEELADRIYNGKAFEGLLHRLTFRLGDMIGDVYGWVFRNRPAASKV